MNVADFSEFAALRLPRSIRRATISEKSASAPVEAFEQLGESPDQANVTGLKSTVVTALSTDRVESNLRRMTSP